MKELTWGKVKRCFSKKWAEQFNLEDNKTVLKELEPSKKLVERSQTVILSHTDDESGRSNAYSRFKLAKRN